MGLALLHVYILEHQYRKSQHIYQTFFFFFYFFFLVSFLTQAIRHSHIINKKEKGEKKKERKDKEHTLNAD